MPDSTDDGLEQLCEALGEAMARIAARREQLAGIAEAQRLLTAELKVHGHELARLTAAIELIGPDDDESEQGH